MGVVAFPSGPDNHWGVNYVSDYGDSIAAILKSSKGFDELAYVLRFYAPPTIPVEELRNEIYKHLNEFGFDPTVA